MCVCVCVCVRVCVCACVCVCVCVCVTSVQIQTLLSVLSLFYIGSVHLSLTCGWKTHVHVHELRLTTVS